MRTFPKVFQEENGLIISDDMNSQIYNHLETFNGGLDRENLPDDVLVLATTTFDTSETTVLNRQITHTFNAFKATGITSQTTYQGNELSKNYSTIMSMDIDTVGGTLVGCTNMNVYIKPFFGSGIIANLMSGYRVGVFIDGLLVAETDNITEERHSFSLPFCGSSLSGTTTLETKVMVISGLTGAVDMFTINRAHFWVREARR
mgnify:FL=1